MVERKKRLSKRQERFVDNMANPAIKSQTQAYQEAFGCEYDSAKVEASRSLTNPNVLARIEERKKEVAKYANITAAQVIGATALRAFATIDDAFDEEGNFDIRKARLTGAIHLIKKISRIPTKEGVKTTVEFYSNETAQDKLGNYLGLEKAPQQNCPPELLAAKAFFDSLIEQGKTQQEAIKEVIQGAKIYGFDFSVDEILNASIIG